MSPNQQAILAGKLLQQAGINMDTVENFIAQLTEAELEEFMVQLEDER
jgi:hypothetical protein